MSPKSAHTKRTHAGLLLRQKAAPIAPCAEIGELAENLLAAVSRQTAARHTKQGFPPAPTGGETLLSRAASGAPSCRGPVAAAQQVARGARNRCPPNLVSIMSQNPPVRPASEAWETRGQTAFRWSVEDLFEHSRAVYLWTFTLVQVMPSWWIYPTWTQLQKRLATTFGIMQGVRVFEWHRDHGLHIHLLINRRMSVRMVRAMAVQFGFGRIHVKRCHSARAGNYLAKYLGKERGKIPYTGRAWARIGHVGCSKNSIQYITPELTQRKLAAHTLRLQGVAPLLAWETVCAEERDKFEDEAWAEYRAAVPNPF